MAYFNAEINHQETNNSNDEDDNFLIKCTIESRPSSEFFYSHAQNKLSYLAKLIREEKNLLFSDSFYENEMYHEAVNQYSDEQFLLYS